MNPLAASSSASQAWSNMAWWAFQIQRGTPRWSVPLWAYGPCARPGASGFRLKGQVGALDPLGDDVAGVGHPDVDPRPGRQHEGPPCKVGSTSWKLWCSSTWLARRALALPSANGSRSSRHSTWIPGSSST